MLPWLSVSVVTLKDPIRVRAEQLARPFPLLAKAFSLSSRVDRDAGGTRDQLPARSPEKPSERKPCLRCAESAADLVRPLGFVFRLLSGSNKPA
jgi:hypothetical protein